MPISKDNMRLIDEGFREYAREAFDKEWDKRRDEWDAVFNGDKTKVMDIVERLKADELPDDRQHQREARATLGGLLDEAADEIERLRQQNAELVEALKMVVCGCDEDRVNCVWGDTCTGYIANNAIAKATGGK